MGNSSSRENQDFNSGNLFGLESEDKEKYTLADFFSDTKRTLRSSFENLVLRNISKDPSPEFSPSFEKTTHDLAKTPIKASKSTDHMNKDDLIQIKKRPSFIEDLKGSLKHLIMRENTFDEDAEEARKSIKVLSGLRERRAVKSFESSTEINVEPILEAITLAPSEFGLTPYKVYMVKDPARKRRLRIVSYSQPQVEEASVLLYFVVMTDPVPVTSRLIRTMNYDVSSPDLARQIRSTYNEMTKDQFTAYARAQAYIALGIAVSVAAELRIASCTMEGFKPVSVGRILGIDSFETVVACLALGAPNPDPSKAHPFAEVRYPKSQIIVDAEEN